jgi:hypothetical protein
MTVAALLLLPKDPIVFVDVSVASEVLSLDY